MPICCGGNNVGSCCMVQCQVPQPDLACWPGNRC
jgi:hypothetical protein